MLNTKNHMKTLMLVWGAISLAMVVHAQQASPSSPALGSTEAKLVSLTNEWIEAVVDKDNVKLESVMVWD